MKLIIIIEKKIIINFLNFNENPSLFLLKIFLFIKLLNYAQLEECTRDNQFLLNNVCVNICEEENLKSNLCKINNGIIKTQFLNNIIYILEDNLLYFNIEESENNNLYCLLSAFPGSNNRVFYALDNEGYGLFNKENPKFQVEIPDESKTGRYESIFFSFQLLSDPDNKEYLVNIAKGFQLIEIYYIYSKKNYFKSSEEFFGVHNIFQYIGTHLKLNKNKKIYIIGFCSSEFHENVAYNYFFLKKGSFTSLDIKNNNQIFETQKEETTDAKIVSCYETLNNFIVCFYQNKEYNYIMVVYDYDLNKKVNIQIAEGISTEGYDKLFFKCIHFFEEAGVFGYFNNDENRKIIFQFKNIQMKIVK